MKRQIGTSLSVLGLVAVGTAAAAVNVRLLNGSSPALTSFAMTSNDDANPLLGTSRTLGSAQPLLDTSTAATASATASASATATATTKPLGTVGSVPGTDGDDHEDRIDGVRAAEDHEDRPQLTGPQLTLLRVSAMVRVSPETVQAVAKGDITDAEVVAAVKRAAEAVGATLAQLAEVALPERHRERGHGGDGERERGDDGGATGTLAPVTGSDNDD